MKEQHLEPKQELYHSIAKNYCRFKIKSLQSDQYNIIKYVLGNR